MQRLNKSRLTIRGDGDQDPVASAEVISICIVIGCFTGMNYNKILMETGKLTDNIRVTKMDSDLVLTKCLSRRILSHH